MLLAVIVVFGCGDGSPPRATPDGAAAAGDRRVAEAGAELRPDGTPDSEVGPVAVGGACGPGAACEPGGTGTPTCRTSWPGGYCLVEACGAHAHDCPGDPGRTGIFGDSICVYDLDGIAVCLRMCHEDADCRPAYFCDSRDNTAGHGLFFVCVPADRCVRCMEKI